MNSLTKETKLTLIYIALAFAFSVGMRMIWVFQFQDMEAFRFNGELMINTNDGYFWAEGARDILSGIHQPNDMSPINHAGSQLTAFFAKIMPFSFETVILYLPVFLSSLIVIPIILIAKDLKNLEAGFIAALLASIAWSYYNRTMVGYIDTDMLNIVLPMFLLWSIILAIDTKEEKYLLLVGLDILVYRWWYPQSYSLEVSFFGLILLYTLIFDRKSIYNYKLLAIMMLAMINLDNYIRFIFVIVAYIVFKQEKLDKYVYYILGVSVVAFLATGGINPIISQLKGYVFKDAIVSANEGLNLHFFSVLQTIREAGQIPFETFANRISGHIVTFSISIVGYIYLVYRHKIMILALPMIGLGFLASVGGLRFTIYAVPILAFGIAFLITEISSKMPEKGLKYVSMIVLTLAVLYPNYKHIDAYKIPTVFNKTEVDVLDKLGNIADREDYVVAWWDYGFPIRYYADVKTLLDGGKHRGNVNYPVSYILTNPPLQAAKMARLDVEYTEANYVDYKPFSNIERMTKDYRFTDTNDFLVSLKKNISLPTKTRDIYIYLPNRMLNILPTVTLFSNLNLETGKQNPRPFLYVAKKFKENNQMLNLGNNIILNKQTGEIQIGNQKLRVNKFIVTEYNSKGILHRNIQTLDTKSPINIIYMKNYNQFLVLDSKMFSSLFIQLFVLENYDKNLFEPVILTALAKVYKLKI